MRISDWSSDVCSSDLVWKLEEGLPGLIADCRKLLDGESRFLFLTVYAVRMSALAIGELLRQALGDLGGTIEAGELGVREEARGLVLPTAIWARWRRLFRPPLIFGFPAIGRASCRGRVCHNVWI